MSLQVKINSNAVRLPEDFELAISLKNNLLDGDPIDRFSGLWIVLIRI